MYAHYSVRFLYLVSYAVLIRAGVYVICGQSLGTHIAVTCLSTVSYKSMRIDSPRPQCWWSGALILPSHFVSTKNQLINPMKRYFPEKDSERVSAVQAVTM